MNSQVSFAEFRMKACPTDSYRFIRAIINKGLIRVSLSDANKVMIDVRYITEYPKLKEIFLKNRPPQKHFFGA